MQTNKLTDEQLISEVVKQLEAKGTRASVEYPTHVFVEPNFAFGRTMANGVETPRTLMPSELN